MASSPAPCLVPSPLPPQQALEQPGGPPEKRRPQRKEAAGDAEADGLVKLISARPTGGGGLLSITTSPMWPARARAAQAADWPRLAGAWGKPGASLRFDLAPKEASAAPAR